jgi:creatinine amidohydrolase
MKRWTHASLAVALMLATPLVAQQPAAGGAGAGRAGAGAGAGAGGGRAGAGGAGAAGAGRAAAPAVQRLPNLRVPAPLNTLNNRPIAMPDNLWMSELTILEMRDLVQKYGYTTAIIGNGTVEANGPYLTTGKHNHVLKVTADRIARTLGNTLIAPLVMLDGGTPATSTTPGRLVLSNDVLKGVLRDMATSLKAQGFKEIFFIGDSGSNQTMLQTVATELSTEWKGQGVLVAHIREYYNYGDVLTYQNNVLLPTLTAAKRIEENKDLDGYHDDYYISSLIMNDDPKHVRFFERKAVGLDQINSVPLVLEEALEVGKRLAQFRADVTVAAINHYRQVGYPDPAAPAAGAGRAGGAGGGAGRATPPPPR